MIEKNENKKELETFSLNDFVENSNEMENIFASGTNKLSVEIEKKDKEQSEKEFEELLKPFKFDKNSKKEIIITGIVENFYNIDIPKGVVGIAEGAFREKGIISVSLPNTLLVIGKDAFRDCKRLVKINIPDSVIYIEDDAFNGDSNLNITIPTREGLFLGKRIIDGTKGVIEEQIKSKYLIEAETEAKKIINSAKNKANLLEKEVEKKIEDELIEAKNQASQIIKNAQIEAKNLVENAHTEVEKELNEATTIKTRIDQETLVLKKNYDVMLNKYQNMQKEYNEKLEEAEIEARERVEKNLNKAQIEAEKIIINATQKANRINNDIEKTKEKLTEIEFKYNNIKNEYDLIITKAKNEAKTIIENTKNEANDKIKSANAELRNAKNKASSIISMANITAEYNHFDMISQRAKKGDADAQFELAQMYSSGKNVAKSPSTAFEWFLKSAKNGNRSAIEAVGDCYNYGVGVKKNSKLALKYYNKAKK